MNRTIHALDAMALCEECNDFIIQNISTRVIPERSVFSFEIRGKVQEMQMYFSLLSRFLAQHNAHLSSPALTFYYSDCNDQLLHYKICYPVSGYWKINNPDIIWEILPSYKIAFIKHFGDYELLPITYRRLRERLDQKGWNCTNEYIENYLITGNRKYANSSTFITDVAAVLQ